MKIAEIRKSSDKELLKQIEKTRESLATLHRDRYVKDEKNVNLARFMKKDLARMLTEKRQRELAQKEEK